MDRLERTFAELGIVVDRSWKSGPPIVTRMGTGPDGLPQISIAARRYREPRLAPYIERALRDARPSEIEPGRWYAELDAFPGVWADGGTSAGCLEALADVLHEWLVIKIIFEDRDVPVLDDLDPRTLVLPIRPPRPSSAARLERGRQALDAVDEV